MKHAVLEPLQTAAQARAADAYTIEELGVPGLVLLEHAGRAIAAHVRSLLPRDGRGARALVLAGKGNNGGDGWVCARHLWASGVPCPVVTLAAPDQLAGDASQAAQLFLTTAEARGWRAEAIDGPSLLVDLADDLVMLIEAWRPDVIVDAMFGTGLAPERALDGVAARVVEQLARVRAPILAVDIPSGVPADGAAPAGPFVHAKRTVTFQTKKIAHASEPGRFACGDVFVEDIGILAPQSPTAGPSAWRLVDARPLAPSAPADAHKGRFGHVAVLEGEHPGAAQLAARGALRAGAGLASVLTSAGAASALGADEARGPPEVMRKPLIAWRSASALVIGPGAGGHRERARELLEGAAEHGLPCVVDAEAIDALFGAPALLALRGLRCVITPHPGEAARVLGISSADVQRDRVSAARALYEKLALRNDGGGHTHGARALVLKGACPLVVAPVAELTGVQPGVEHAAGVVVVEGGHAALAVAGSGDVLAGVIAALLARGLTLAHAALLGVDLHQRAGAQLSASGGRGALASEIADAVARLGGGA